MTNSVDLDVKLKHLQQWFEENPQLPEKVEPILLRRFLKCMSYDLDETKKLILLNYSLRNKNANIFIERNPEDEATAKGLLVSDLLILPGVTPEGHKLVLFRLADYDPSTRNTIEESKIFFMMTDLRFTMPDCDPTNNIRTVSKDDQSQKQNHEIITHDKTLDNDCEAREAMNDVLDEDIADGDVQIVDIAGYTMRHITRISFFVLRIYMRFLQEAYPSRLRAMHVINCPSFLDKMIAIVKPFIREEVYQMIHFHTEGLDSLYEQVPRDMLPEEYGGKAGKVADLKAYWIQALKEKQEYLADSKYWRNMTPQTRSRWSWF